MSEFVRQTPDSNPEGKPCVYSPWRHLPSGMPCFVCVDQTEAVSHLWCNFLSYYCDFWIFFLFKNLSPLQVADYSYRASVQELLPQVRYLDNVKVEDRMTTEISDVPGNEFRSSNEGLSTCNPILDRMLLTCSDCVQVIMWVEPITIHLGTLLPAPLPSPHQEAPNHPIDPVMVFQKADRQQST